MYFHFPSKALLEAKLPKFLELPEYPTPVDMFNISLTLFYMIVRDCCICKCIICEIERRRRELTPEEMALLNLSVLELEYGRYVRLLRLWERSGFSTVKLSDVRRRVYGVYLRAFERAHLYELTLPIDAKWKDVIKLIEGLS